MTSSDSQNRIRTSRGSIAITNARLVPVASEVIDNGTIVVIDGVIRELGAKVQVPAGIDVIDAGGRAVYPGFVEAHGHLGVHEEAEGWAGNDTN